MKLGCLIALLPFLIATAHSQSGPDLYVACLEMPCYPPLVRQAQLQGTTEVGIELDEAGTVMSLEGLHRNKLLQDATIANVKKWKFASGQGQKLLRVKAPIVFEYKLEPDSGWERCASRVGFDSFRRVEVTAHRPLETVNYEDPSFGLDLSEPLRVFLTECEVDGAQLPCDKFKIQLTADIL